MLVRKSELFPSQRMLVKALDRLRTSMAVHHRTNSPINSHQPRWHFMAHAASLFWSI